ncbi:MAG: DUF389 domain-containing protein [Actinomycetota bacterium]|nr:DUF389 domain-containing protein [Actinomycetota bacterium]
MVHLRVVAPAESADQAVELLQASPSVASVIVLRGAARKPEGDVILCDVAREDASVIIEDLKELGIHETGSISVEQIDTQISEIGEAAERHAAGLPSDAVIWEDVEARSEEMTELSLTFVAYMVLAMLIAAVGILLDQPILIVGAMVVGPEFGPLAGLCVALVEKRPPLVRRSLAALAAGFPIGIVITLLVTLAFDGADLVPDEFDPKSHPLTSFIASPDFFSFFVAYIAGTAGILALTSAKSGALIGVLISVTTIPAAANIAVGSALGEWREAIGAAAQLGLNLTAIVLAGVVTLYLQRRDYLSRRQRHLRDPIRGAAGLPIGRSRMARRARRAAPPSRRRAEP